MLLPRRMRNRHLLLLDAASLVVAPAIAFAVRFEDFRWLGDNLTLVLPYILIAGPLRLAVFYSFGMYKKLWRQASIGELRQILVAGAAAGFVSAVVGLWLLPTAQITAGRAPFSV